MTIYTKTEGTQESWDALDDSYYSDDPLAIQPEICSEDGETFIYLSLVILTSTGGTYFPEGGVSVELGRYDDDDDETAAKAYKKAIKEAAQFDIYVTETA